MKRSIVGALAGLAVAAPGCAVGYGVGVQSGSVAATANPRAGFPEDGPARVSSVYQELRIIDSTGLLLAAVVNTGRQYTARQDAMEHARYQRPGQDGTVRVAYAWKPMPILAGLLTDFRLRVPLGTPTLEMPEGTNSGRELDFWAFDLRPEFYTFRPSRGLPLVSSLWLNVEAASWKAPADVDFSVTQLDMGFGTTTSYVVRPDVTATARVKLGLLSPLFAAIGGGSKLNGSAEIEVGYRPLSTDKIGVMISGTAYLGREGAFERSMLVSRIGLNVALMFGNQVPKRARTPPPPAGTGTEAPASTRISGQLCLGASPAPQCPQIAGGVPPAVQLLFVACAQATLEAGKTGDFLAQRTVCRTSASGITRFIAQAEATLDEPTRRLVYSAAATSYDLAGAGYEVTAGAMSAEHCAMVNATFTYVIGFDRASPTMPSKVAGADQAVLACREVFDCGASDADVVCTPRAPAVPAAPPALAP